MEGKKDNKHFIFIMNFLRKEQKKAKRVNLCRIALINIMFHKKISSLKDERDGVWVDGETLCRFISCDVNMGDLLSNPTQPNPC